MLAIKILNDKPLFIGTEKYVEARIMIGEHEEDIEISLNNWGINDYKRQWQEGIERIKTHDTSCIIIAVEDEKYAQLINWFLLYKKDKRISVQHHLFVGESYEEYIGDDVITPENCYDFIPAYHKEYKDHEIVIFDENELDKNINLQVTIRNSKIIHEMMSVQGIMQLGSTSTDLVMPIAHWSTNDYERQWLEGIARIKKSDKSCIVTRVFPTRMIDWYVLYKKDEKVYAYRYFLVAQDYDKVIGDEKFTPDNCYDFIPSFDEYQKVHAKEFKIEEWEIDLQDIYDAQIIVPE